jgi:hypothetical protein
MDVKLLFSLVILFGCAQAPRTPAAAQPTIESNTSQVKPKENKTLEKVLNWKDRRPIGMIMLSSNNGQFVKGKRQWKLMGGSGFSKTALMEHANVSIKNLKAIKAQGMITWDIEGQEYPHPFSYLGDPRRIPPEMDIIADEYFKKFRDAGLKIGVCIRPDSLNYKDGWARHYTAFNPYQIMVDKIKYAYDRWGCRIFYIDSNIGEGQIPGTDNSPGYGPKLNVEIFKALFKRFPDCLIIPEFYYEDYLEYAAPLNKHNGPHVLKKGFQILDISDTKWNDWQIEECVRQGGILMGRVWYNSPELTAIRKFNKLKRP